MRDSSRIGYAQARVQARFSDRPAEAFWRELEAGRELPHLMDIVRLSTLGAAIGPIAAPVNGHALEAQLRKHWVSVCAEVASWYPPEWRAAMQWLAWLPWLAGLEWLARERPAPAWMESAPLLGELLAEAADVRDERLRVGMLAPLAEAFSSGQGLAIAWHERWRDQWPCRDARLRRGLGRLDAALESFLPGTPDKDAAPFDAAVDVAERAVRRVFRRFAGTPVAGTSLLVLLALDHARLRAALVAACWFGVARTA